MSKWVYKFGNGSAEGGAEQKNLFGGKGANLMEMNKIGLPVPAGFTVTTEVCTYYYDHKNEYPSDLMEQVRDGVAHIESIMNKKFADAANPLLVSVRSGARVSMPGMMDTVLNLGLNDETVQGLAKIAESCEFFEFGTNDLTQTVLGMSRDDTGAILDEYRAKGVYVADPFASIDQQGVGVMIADAVKKARAVKGDKIYIGVCGEHGGDPESVKFFHKIGLDGVSCSPFRVPIARLAAAQAAVKEPRK